MHARKIISYLFISLLLGITCIGARAYAWTPLGQGSPGLQVGGVTALYGENVTVPITFNSNGSDITSMVFSIDFDESCLDFVSVQLSGNIPAGYSKSASYNASQTDSEVDYLVSIPLRGSPSLPLVNHSRAVRKLRQLTFPIIRQSALAMPVGIMLTAAPRAIV